MANSAASRLPPVLRTIIFDLGGVCFTDGTSRAIDRLADKYSLRKKDVAAVLSGPLGSEYRTGSINCEDFWIAACKYWEISAGPDYLNRIWLSGYRRIPGTFSILGRLQRAGHELLYLSDNVPERVNYLETRYHFLQFFNNGIFSYQAKLRKPDPRLYRLILQKASRTAEQCLYIDDVEGFLDPARELGMTTIHFQEVSQLSRELNLLGLL